MPLSKNGKLYYTDEQYKKAMFETTALEYVQSLQIPLEPDGKYYRHKEHDSLIFTPNGKFFWNSHNLSGGAVNYACFVEGKTFVEAVLAVAGEQLHIQQSHAAVKLQLEEKREIKSKEFPTDAPKPIEFKLPEVEEGKPKRLFAYLCNERKIDNLIVSTCLHEKSIYQSAKHGNVVFVGYDETGEAKCAYLRGTLTYVKEQFRGDVAGGAKNVPFALKADTVKDTVYVFEAPIDLLSHATLTKFNSHENWRDVDRIALAGTCDNCLLWYLDKNPNIRNVCLCLDNDEAGKIGTAKIGSKLDEQGYNVSVQYPSNKDWNEDLKAHTAQEYHVNKLSLLYQNNQADTLDDTECSVELG